MKRAFAIVATASVMTACGVLLRRAVRRAYLD